MVIEDNDDDILYNLSSPPTLLSLSTPSIQSLEPCPMDSSTATNRRRFPRTFDLFFCDCPRRLFYIVLSVILGLALLILVIVVIVCTHKHHRPQDSDHCLLARQWPPTACVRSKKCTTTSSKLDRWTIHGLWPNYSNNTYKEFCRHDPFDASALSSIKTKLQDSWPDMFAADGESFWRHEWDKHGTCMDMSQFDYFDRTLALDARYPLTEWLRDGKVAPGKDSEYTVEDVLQALSPHIPRASVAVDCFQSKKVVYLSEIKFCFGRAASNNFEPIDCLAKSSCRGRFKYLSP